MSITLWNRHHEPARPQVAAVKRKPLVVMAIAVFLTPPLVATPAYAFGLGDLVNIGIGVGEKLVGAGIDKVKDAMRDPEAEAQKKREEEQRIAEQFQLQVAKIEAKKELRPLERERLVIVLNQQYAQVKQFQAFVEQAEARQREERDKIFTLGGLAGVAGTAIMNSPTVVMARADAMVKTGIPQAQARASIAQADLLTASGAPQVKAQAAMLQADAIQKAGVSLLPELSEQLIDTHPSGAVVDTADEATTSGGPALGGAPALSESAAALSPVDPTMPPNAFSGDLGRKLFVEYIGSPSMTDAIHQQLATHGHILTSSADNADVYYRIEGEYTVPETNQFEGMVRDAGDLIENPSQPLPPPDKKIVGSLKLGIAKAVFGLAAIQGAAVPQEMAPQEQTGFRQTLLLVAARQPKEEKETRVSVLKASEGSINGIGLAQAANADLMEILGLAATPAVAPQGITDLPSR